MTFTPYFEKLSPGLKAKLDARYRIRTGQVLKDVGLANGLWQLRNHSANKPYDIDVTRFQHDRI
ncbi:MAG: hypothetical protein N2506_01205 [Dehalococcoidales bacterium]|nr:hypothetical protein [Dehalococcoidales bacterium]